MAGAAAWVASGWPGSGWVITPAEVDPVRFWVLAHAAVFCAGLAKSGFGSGLGLVAVPLMVGACWVPSSVRADQNVSFALALMLPLLIACDWIAVANWWRRWDVRLLLGLLPGSAVGVVVAWLVFGAVADVKGGLMVCLGVIAWVMALAQLVGRRWSGGGNGVDGAGVGGAVWRRHAVCTTAGFTSMIGHAAGPILALHLLSLRVPRDVFVGTSAAYFCVLNQAKLLPMGELGLLTRVPMGTVLVLLGAVAAGSLCGRWLAVHVGQAWFNRIAYGSVFASGGVLIWAGWGL